MNVTLSKYSSFDVKPIIILVIFIQILLFLIFSINGSTVLKKARSNFVTLSTVSNQSSLANDKRDSDLYQFYHNYNGLKRFKSPLKNLNIHRQIRGCILSENGKIALEKAKKTNLYNLFAIISDGNDTANNWYKCVNSGDYNDGICEINLNQEVRCRVIVDILKCKNKEIMCAVKLKGKNNNIENLNNLIEACDSLLNIFKNLRDDVKEKNIKRKPIDEELSELEKNCNQSITEEINIILKHESDLYIMICYILNDDTVAAAIKSMENLDIKYIPGLIKHLYNCKKRSNELSYLTKIQYFISNLTNNSHKAKGYQAYYDEMTSKNNLNIFEILTFTSELRKQKTLNISISLTLKIESNILPKFQRQWANIMFNNSKDEEFTNITTYFDIFTDYLNGTLQIAFQNENALVNNFDNILKSILDLPHSKLYAIGYTVVFHEMIKQNLTNEYTKLAKLAYYVKHCMNMVSFGNMLDMYKKMINQIKQDMPFWLQKLAWEGDKCKLKNRYDGYFLVPTDKWKSPNERRNVFLMNSDDSNMIYGTAPLWQFMLNKNGNFEIISVKYNEYLTTQGAVILDWNKEEVEKLFVSYTLKNKDPLGSEWIVEGTSNNFIRIRSVYDVNRFYTHSVHCDPNAYKNIYPLVSAAVGADYLKEWRFQC